MQTYLFYDIETTGLNKAFDQVLHFAAIRTDLNLQELNRYEFKVKLNSDVIPSPYALLTHRMGIKEITSGISEFEAIKQIHQLMNEPGTISLGYNTLGFDDEFLRFSFYRNLLKPYTHQYANLCGRMDLYPMTVMFYLFKNTALKWPQRADGLSLKLEEINAANQFYAGQSHNAMVDVEVTLALARYLSQEREMWEYLHGYFKKEIDGQRTQSLQKEMALFVKGKIGKKLHFQSPVLFLGQHCHYKNQSMWLRLDTENLTQTTPETIKETTWVFNKKPGEPSFVLPFKERFLQHMEHERLKLAEENHRWLQTNPAMLEAITAYHVNYLHPVYPQTDIEARLYLDGFFSKEEEIFCYRFHTASLKEKALLTEQVKLPRLKALSLRILGRNYPELLSDADKARFADYRRQAYADNETDVLIDHQGTKRATPQSALADIDAIRSKGPLLEKDAMLLNEYETYLREIL